MGGERRDPLIDELSERDREVLAQMAAGKTNRGIARRMYLRAGAIAEGPGLSRPLVHSSRRGTPFAGKLDEVRSFHEGQLVTLVGEHESLDGIVVHAPSFVKVEVVVPDTGDGPVFRTVHPKLLRERSEPGEHDDALRKLIRRTASAGRGGPRTGAGSARRGFSHPSGHRTTGK